MVIATDHKPLVPLFSNKYLHAPPPHMLRFRLRLNRFNHAIYHTPGKEMYTADTLSRPPTALPGKTSLDFKCELKSDIDTIMTLLPATKGKLEPYAFAQAKDSVWSRILEFCRLGWPEKHEVHASILPYWKDLNKFTISGSLSLHGSRIAVPKELQQEVLQKIKHRAPRH